MALYIVSYAWHEDYCPTIVEGPEQTDWEAYCRSLLDEAAKLAIEGKGHHPWLEPREGFIDGTWIGVGEVQENLVSVLEENGYKRVELPEFELWGPCILDDCTGLGFSDEAAASLKDYNKELERKERANDPSR